MSDDSRRTAALLAVTLSSFLTPLTLSSVNIALPAIGLEFHSDAVTLGWIPTSYLLASAMFMLPFGRLADIYGRRRLFLIGTAVFGLATVLCGLAVSAPMLIALRVLQGIGGAMGAGTGVAILTSVYPSNQKGRVLGITTAAVYTGLSLGPFIGGILTGQFGWRSIFLMSVPLAVAAFAVAFWKLNGEWAEARGERFDVPGTAIYALALLGLIYGMLLLPAAQGLALLFLGLLGLLGFVALEMRVASPILNLSLFRGNSVFTLSNLAAFINYSATSAVSFLLSLYLQQIKGFSPQQAGVILIAQPVVQAVFSPLSGRLSDTIEPRILASAGMALTAGGLFLLSLLGPDSSVYYIAGVLMLLGFGFALFSSPNTNAVMSAVERRFYGVAAATLSTMRTTGQMLSTGIAVLAFAVIIGRVQITPALYPQLMTSIRLVFTVFAVLCVAGIFASLARGNVRPAARSKQPAAEPDRQ